MPKVSGAGMKITRLAGKPPAPTRKIMRFEAPSGPKVDPMSPGAPKQADHLKDSPDGDFGGINPRQQIY